MMRRRMQESADMNTFTLKVGAATLAGFVIVWLIATNDHRSAFGDVVRHALGSLQATALPSPEASPDDRRPMQMVAIKVGRERAANNVRKSDGYCGFEFASNPDLIPTCLDMQRDGATIMRNFYDGVIKEPDDTMVAAALLGVQCDRSFTRGGMTDWNLAKVCLLEGMKEMELKIRETH